MNTSKKGQKDFIKSIQFVHIAMLSSVVIFAVYVIVTSINKLFFSYSEGKSFLYLAILISFAGNLASKFMYAKNMKKIDKNDSFYNKASKFSAAHIVRMALLEFPAFMCIIFVMKSYNTFYFILAAILVAMMVTIYPTLNKFIKDVQLKPDEKSMLEKQ